MTAVLAVTKPERTILPRRRGGVATMTSGALPGALAVTVPPGRGPAAPARAGMHSGWQRAGEALTRVARLHMAVGDADGNCRTLRRRGPGFKLWPAADHIPSRRHATSSSTTPESLLLEALRSNIRHAMTQTREASHDRGAGEKTGPKVHKELRSSRSWQQPRANSGMFRIEETKRGPPIGDFHIAGAFIAFTP